jgi:WD40 repeat protein
MVIEPVLNSAGTASIASSSTRMVAAEVVSKLSAVQLLGHARPVTEVAFSPDGRLLATASQDQTARIWEVATGHEHSRIAHDSPVTGVAFSPDGRLLAAASQDQTARIWELASGHKHAQVTHGDQVWGWRSVLMGGCWRPPASTGRRGSGSWQASAGERRSSLTRHRALGTSAATWCEEFLHCHKWHAFGAPGRPALAGSCSERGRTWGVALDDPEVLRLRWLRSRGVWPSGAAAWPAASAWGRPARAAAAAPLPRHPPPAHPPAVTQIPVAAPA